MDLILLFIDVSRKIALFFAVVIFLPDIITREMRLTKRLLPIFIGTLSIMLSGTILKHMLISERAVVAQSTVESVLSGNDDTERQEITVEWYSDEDDSQDQAIVGIIGDIGTFLSDILIVLAFPLFMGSIFMILSSLLAGPIFADSGKIKPEIYELEKKIEKEMERKITSDHVAEENNNE